MNNIHRNTDIKLVNTKFLQKSINQFCNESGFENDIYTDAHEKLINADRLNHLNVVSDHGIDLIL